MNEISILIVEDDANAIESWQRDINDFNDESPISYLPTFAKTREEALRHLRYTYFDCAVVDLRLPTSNTAPLVPTHQSGNDVLDQLLVETGIPAVVYSGHPKEASQTVQDSNIEIMLKKGNGTQEILQYFVERQDLMHAMKATRQKIAIESAKIFNDSIWRRWESTWHAHPDNALLTDIIARQISSHVADRLSVPPANHHPDEFYVIPPLFTERLDTGDLVKVRDDIYVIVTPRCNLANLPYPKHLTLALCSPMTEEWGRLKDSLTNGGQAKQDSGRKRLRNFAIQNHASSSHFIPPCGDMGPWLVNFDEVMSMPAETAPDLLKNRFASIATHFVPNLIQRYSTYLGRIGQPDLNHDFLEAHVRR